MLHAITVRCHVISALEEVLPIARSTKDSMVVLLDSFAAHLTDGVAEAIERRGHIVLYHGGGCTPFTQVNDVILHAPLQRHLQRIENQITHAKRKDMYMNAGTGIPTLHRHEICEIAAAAWRSLPHGELSRKGYRQTGPFLPDSGPILRDMVGTDLRDVLDAIDPPSGLQEVGQSLRDDAQAFVDDGYPSKWSRWEHVRRLIEAHDDANDPIPEGLEGFGFEVVRDGGEGMSSVDSNDGDPDAEANDLNDVSAIVPVEAPVEAPAICDGGLACAPADLSVANAVEVLIGDFFYFSPTSHTDCFSALHFALWMSCGSDEKAKC